TPNEVDYAFFVDRVTHLDGPPEDEPATLHAMSACMRQEKEALNANAAARRCLARLQPHERQAETRLARDVAYYLDGYPDGALSPKEVRAWSNYVPLSATHTFGLSEERPFQIERAVSLDTLGNHLPRAYSSELTPAEA